MTRIMTKAVDENNDTKYMRAYTIGLFILSFLNESMGGTRVGAEARVYNCINKKHEHFFDQFRDLRKKKRDKISKKCKIFEQSCIRANIVWKTVMEEQRGVSFCPISTASRLFFGNEELLEDIYRFDGDDFRQLNRSLGVTGVGLSSVRIGRRLIEEYDNSFPSTAPCDDS